MAEVLITLMILGVIAMVTIPGLIASYKKHLVETQLKTAYSTITNILLKAQADTGDSLADIVNLSLGDCSGSGCWQKQTPFMENYILPYAQYKEKCATYTTCSSPNLKKIYYNDVPYGIFLNSGFYFEVYGHSYQQLRFLVDINGRTNPPNQDGYDIFYFKLTRNAKRLEGFWDRDADYECKSGLYYACADAIMRNGWKIPNNYPVKF